MFKVLNAGNRLDLLKTSTGNQCVHAPVRMDVRDRHRYTPVQYVPQFHIMVHF